MLNFLPAALTAPAPIGVCMCTSRRFFKVYFLGLIQYIDIAVNKKYYILAYREIFQESFLTGGNIWFIL